MGRATGAAAAAIAAAVLLPCVAWWVVGSRSVERERIALEREAWARVQDRADAVAARVARRLEDARAREGSVPWREWTARADPAPDGVRRPVRDQGLVAFRFEIDLDRGVSASTRRSSADALRALARPLGASIATPPRPDEIVEPEPDPLPWRVGRPPTDDVALLTQGPLQWRTVSIDGTPHLTAVREIRTSSGVRVQGFAIDPDALDREVPASVGRRLVHGPRQAPGEAELPLAATVWRAVVDPSPEIDAARDAAAASRRKFLTTFVAGSAVAMIAGGLGLGWVRQRERTAALRERWAAAAAHELRGPLAGLRLHAELLADRIGHGDDPAPTLDVLTREVEQLEHVVDNVIAYGRMRRGVGRLPVEADDVDGVVRTVVTSARPFVADLGADLVLEIEPDLPPARFDAAGLRHVLWNLIDNAARHGPGDGGRIRVRARAAGDGHVAIDVEDDGPGLPDGVARTVLRRGRDAALRPDGGLGIGLALARRICRAMGGDLHHERPSGGGTRMTIRLPAERGLVVDAPD